MALHQKSMANIQNKQKAYHSAVSTGWIKGQSTQPEISLGKQGGMVTLHQTGLPFSDIAKEIENVSERTVSQIVKQVYNNAEANDENHNPLVNINLYPKKHTDKPQKYTEHDKGIIVELSTHNRTQRWKSYVQLSHKCPFPISANKFIQILKERSYSKYISRHKPRILPENKEKRLEFSQERIYKPIQNYWDGWLWTDEMSLHIGDHYGPATVIQNDKEEYHTDWIDEEWPGETTIMFWAVIIYGLPYAECPYYIWEIETKEEKEAAQVQIDEWNKDIKQINTETYKKLKAANQVLPQGQRKCGRLPNPDWVKIKRRGKKLKGGIDWFRYKKHVLDLLLYPFYDHMMESYQKGERGKIVHMKDGAGSYWAESLNSFCHERGINKVDWLASSLDFNPIEQVWNVIRRAICNSRPFPTTRQSIKVAWIEEFKKLPVEKTNALIESILRRLQKCILAGGGNNFCR